MDKKLSFLVIVFFLVLALFSTIVIKKSVGQLASQCAVTDDSGIAQVTASSTTAGTGQITANITGLFEIATKGSCNFTL